MKIRRCPETHRPIVEPDRFLTDVQVEELAPDWEHDGPPEPDYESSRDNPADDYLNW